VSLAEAERRAGDLVAVGGDPPELRGAIASFTAPLEPFLERLRRELRTTREARRPAKEMLSTSAKSWRSRSAINAARL
jgi:hypothetical protein